MKTIEINNKRYQDYDLVMIETSKTNNLNDIVLNQEKTRLATLNPLTVDSTQPCTNQHLYITSNEKIKVGDWVIYTNPHSNRTFLVKCSETTKTYFDYERKTLDIRQIPIEWAKKVIATTDSSLYTHQKETTSKSERVFYIHQIPQDFIEYFINEYNRGNVITKVLVEVEVAEVELWMGQKYIPVSYKIKLNQNSEISILTASKHNTLQQSALDYLSTRYGKMDPDEILKFVEGTEWQAARSYTKEEVTRLLQQLESDIKESRSLYDNQGMVAWLTKNLTKG
jgi:hypothetical protein